MYTKLSLIEQLGRRVNQRLIELLWKMLFYITILTLKTETLLRENLRFTILVCKMTLTIKTKLLTQGVHKFQILIQQNL